MVVRIALLVHPMKRSKNAAKRKKSVCVKPHCGSARPSPSHQQSHHTCSHKKNHLNGMNFEVLNDLLEIVQQKNCFRKKKENHSIHSTGLPELLTDRCLFSFFIFCTKKKYLCYYDKSQGALFQLFWDFQMKICRGLTLNAEYRSLFHAFFIACSRHSTFFLLLRLYAS